MNLLGLRCFAPTPRQHRLQIMIEIDRELQASQKEIAVQDEAETHPAGRNLQETKAVLLAGAPPQKPAEVLIDQLKKQGLAVYRI